jgi:neutral amino acid transport system ATP-binding protein
MTYFATQGLHRTFGGVTAVDRASVEVRQGRINGLIGPNGSGKTTFFNLVTGMIRPDAGSVVYRDVELAGRKPHQITLAGIGRTFQVTRLFARMTVLENMLVALRRGGLRAMLRSALHGVEIERADGWLQRVGLEHLRGVEARRLSYGQQKLLELAAVMMAEPDLILLDEPAGGVNPVMIERLIDLVRQLNTEGHTFLVVEHNMELVMNLCEHVIVFSNGSPIASGPPARVRDDQRVLEAYLGV